MLFINIPALQIRASLTLEKHHGKYSDELQTTAEQIKTAQYLNIFLIAHVTKKLKRFIFNDDVKPKGEQSSIHQHLLNNPVCAENYLDNRFEILSRARNTYHLSVLESLFIRTREPKICKQRDFYNLKLYK